MKRIDFPYGIDGRGLTAETDRGNHLRDLIEQLLFTTPGERVMRPDFGGGVLQLVFAPAGDQLAATTQFLVQGALQQWLGERILVEDVAVAAEDSTLRVEIRFLDRRTGESRTELFEGPRGAS